MERRKHDRVNEGLDRLRIWILFDKGPLPTRLIDVSAGGAALEVEHDGAEVRTNQETVLRFFVGSGDACFDMHGIIRNVRSSEGRSTLGIEFTDPSLLQLHLPPSLFKLFNRRRSFRVNPAPDEPITVSLRRSSDNLRLKLGMADISAEGVGATGANPSCGLLVVEDRVEIRFSLPGASREVVFQAIVRSVVSREPIWRVGLSFAETSPQFARHQNAVQDYVLRRQHDAMRRGGDSRPRAPVRSRRTV